jgi:Protein of unknown function (DUF3631)
MNIDKMSNAELDAIIDDGGRMLASVYGFLGRFVAYPSEHARVAHALWIVHTHLMDRWESTPRLALLSPEPASGKTRALEITELLVPNPVSAVNVSPAYLFRKVGNEEGVTILFDEIDTVFGPKAKENEEIRGLLNAGHRRGAVAGRCVVHGKQVVTEEIPAYAPVALAGLGWLPDTIMSRSVIIRMRRRSQGEKVEQFRRRIQERQGHQIRALIQQWAQEAEIAWPELPPEIQDRDADVWEPLIAIADAVGSEWPTRARVAAVTLVAASKEVDPSLGIRLLADLRTIFSDREQMTTKEVLQALNNLDESPWGDLKGKPLDERSLARRLKQYGIKSKNLNLGGYDRPKGYHRDDLYDAWNRYLPSPPSSETTATSATGATEPGLWAEKVADVADSSEKVADALLKNGNGMSEVAEVADVADLSAHAGRVCAQCGAGPSTTPRGDLSTYQVGGIWLLGSCRRFWSLRA